MENVIILFQYKKTQIFLVKIKITGKIFCDLAVVAELVYA